MSHQSREKLDLLNRTRKVRGQLESVERALTEDAPCVDVLQRLSAARGAINSLMGELMEDHILHHMGGKPDGDIDTRAARLAQAVSSSDDRSTAALVAALYAAGFRIRAADGTMTGPARGGQGMAFDDWQMAVMAKLYGREYGVPLDRLAEAFVRNVPEFKDAALASMLLDGIRAAAEAEWNPPLRFWAQFIVALGRYSREPYDLLNPTTPETVRLDAVQTQLILIRLAGDIALLEPRGARRAAGARDGSPILLASFTQDPPAPLPCAPSDAENLILDTTATAAINTFAQVASALPEHGYGGIGSYAKGAGRAGLVPRGRFWADRRKFVRFASRRTRSGG